MKSKAEVLILTDWFVPAFKAGGPVRSIYNLCNAIQDSVRISVITGDRDWQDNHPFENISIGQWTELENYRVLYVEASKAVPAISAELRSGRYDTIYLNSFFSVHFTILPLFKAYKWQLLHRVILAPRGMLGAGALSIKPVKKGIFIRMFKLFGLNHKVLFHATDITEAKDIQTTLGKNVSIEVISNIPTIAPATSDRLMNRPVRFVFASRLSPKKNALKVLIWMREMDFQAKLSMAGTIEDEAYAKRCLDQVEMDDRMEYLGVLPPEGVLKLYERADFFILPTMNENFGHAIIEALAAGVPVIISDQTPWCDVEQYGAGWVISLSDSERWKAVIREAASLDPDAYDRMSTRAMEYVRDKFNFAEIRSQYLQLFAGQNRS